MKEKIELKKVLEHGDSILIADGFYADVYFHDLEDFSNQPYNPEYDESNVGDEWPTTYVIKDKENNVVATCNGHSYVSGGDGDKEIYEENLKHQQEDINNIREKFPEILKETVEHNEKQNKTLKESLNSLIDIVPADIPKVIEHGTFLPLPGSNELHVVFRDVNDHEGQPYDPQYDEGDENRWPKSYIIKDANGDLIEVWKGKTAPHISGGEHDAENIKNQNVEIKAIFRDLKKIIEDKIDSNSAQNVKLEKTLEGIKKEGLSIGNSIPGL